MIAQTLLYKSNTNSITIIDNHNENKNIGFLYLIQYSYTNNTYESFIENWQTKGAGGEDQTGTIFMLDEPSGIIYEYLYDDFLATQIKFLENMTSDEHDNFTKNPEEFPCGADFCRNGTLKYISYIHKKNLFELFLTWQKILNNQKNYLVWYTKTNWVHLESFSTQEDARNFMIQLLA